MSAVLQLPMAWETSAVQEDWRIERRRWERKPAAQPQTEPAEAQAEPPVNLAFYRRHTESMLRRYLYASMQVGRAPSLLADSVGRGWASSRRIRTFEDAVIFVLDIEKCIGQLGSLDRAILSRIVLQEYTQAETAVLLGMSIRAISYKYPLAVDRLTEKLLAASLLILPH
ncbi:MAG: sigma factor-like helix-turn-helix DNA-binding protein [Terracidiphilus sp.]|nr:sigma factor-like helix-turn-helix DNA-binding protein [Terracidiphilus sp.]MDR3797638.1 sigma factor-like helix-turn-helix DNA-binding protein [Terracidiphilus sp.]